MNVSSSVTSDYTNQSVAEFDFSISWKKLLLFSLAFGLLTLSPLCVEACFIALSLYSLCGRRHALEAMALSVVAKYANPALVAFPSFFGFYAWGFLFIASMSLFARSRVRNNPVIFPLTIFYITILCISFWSRYPAISLLKATSFYIVVAAILSGSFSMTRDECIELARSIFVCILAVLLLSMPTYFFHNIGFLRNGRGFQGILNHPQTFGIFFVPFCSWFLSNIIFKMRPRISVLQFIIFSISFMFMIFSQSRTSIIATLLALLLSFPALLRFNLQRGAASLYKCIVIVFFALFLLVAAAGLSDKVSDGFVAFITKGHTNRTVGEAFDASRGVGVVSQLQNFLKSPWIGNGFGVDNTADFGSRVKYLMGIPVSAASEKGIVYTAVLEEIGLVGLIPFIVFLGFLVARGVKNDFPLIALFFACLTVNIGEAVFFSVNGNGLFYWVLVGLCMSCSVHRVVVYNRSCLQLVP